MSDTVYPAIRGGSVWIVGFLKTGKKVIPKSFVIREAMPVRAQKFSTTFTHHSEGFCFIGGG